MADFIPKRDASLGVWLESLKRALPDYAADFELTPARMAQVNDWIDAHLAALKLVRQKHDEWLSASTLKKQQAHTSLAGLRQEIARWKTAPGAVNGGLAALKLTASLPVLDTSTHQPELIAKVWGGAVRLRFKKRGATNVNIYMRIDGTAEWHLVSRATRSPYLDPTPVAVPGQAETREYRAISVVNDQEIGQPSSIARITVPGTIMI